MRCVRVINLLSVVCVLRGLCWDSASVFPQAALAQSSPSDPVLLQNGMTLSEFRETFFAEDIRNTKADRQAGKPDLSRAEKHERALANLEKVVSFPPKTGPLHWPREGDLAWRGSDIQTKTF